MGKYINRRNKKDKCLSSALIITAFLALFFYLKPVFSDVKLSCVYNTPDGNQTLRFSLVNNKLTIQEIPIKDVKINTFQDGSFSFANENIEIMIYKDGFSTISPSIEITTLTGQCYGL